MRTLEEIEALIEAKEEILYDLVDQIKNELDDLRNEKYLLKLRSEDKPNLNSETLPSPKISTYINGYVVEWLIFNHSLTLYCSKEDTGWSIWGVVNDEIKQCVPHLPDEIKYCYRDSLEQCINDVNTLLKP